MAEEDQQRAIVTEVPGTTRDLLKGGAKLEVVPERPRGETALFDMKDKKGEFVGFEIDVAKRFARDLGVKIELVVRGSCGGRGR